MPKILFFPYFGPNRRSDRRVVELRLGFGPGHETEFPEKESDIRQPLLDAGILNEQDSFPGKELPGDRVNWYASLLAETILLLQRKNNHRVDFYSTSFQVEKNRCMVLVEHEHSEVGMAAVKLAIELFTGQLSSLANAYRQFSEFALERALPVETEAIIRAAEQAEIPFFQLEREPLTGKFNTGIRVRQNGLLSLGHGAAGHVLDGTFCVNKAGEREKALLRNPDQRLALVRQLGIPLSRKGNTGELDSGLFHLLIINRQIIAATRATDGGTTPVGDWHDKTIEQARAISGEVGFAPVAVSVQSNDIAQPLEQTGGVVDFDLAPDLQQLLGGCEAGAGLLNSAATELINWLFPEKGQARMPIVAVTGTNGKTTTSRMINHVMAASGRKPGLVCTDGIFLNGRQVSAGDAGSFIGHARLLTSGQVDTAVLEAHHRGLAVRGLAFDKCNVAVCLNVTEEHIEKGEVESVEEMTRIKRSLLERASEAAVLFVDDPNCFSMLPFIKGQKICLVSLRSDVAQLRPMVPEDRSCFCVVESVGDDQWMVFYAGDQRLPVMPVNRVPATFDGAAKFNVSNAMHAIAVSYLLGIGTETISAAMSRFSAGRELTPGRMNVFDGLGFRVVMDFAHNPDGMRQVCEFIDEQPVTGRKIIAFSGLGKRSDDLNRKSAQAVAGHFDFYFCKDIEPSQPPKRKFTGPFMQQVLIEEGIPRQATRVTTFGRNVIFNILDYCQPGDLLLLLVGLTESTTVPGHIQEYKELKRRQAHPG